MGDCLFNQSCEGRLWCLILLLGTNMPNGHFVDWVSGGFGLGGLGCSGVADVESSDDVPVGFGSNCSSYVCQTGFPCAPADSDTE